MTSLAMNVDLIQILNPIGQAKVTQIQQNLAQTGTDASGQTSRSTRFTVTQDNTITRFQIVGKPYYMVVETGRKPTPDKKPSRDMIKNITEWIQVRGLPNIAWAIAVWINKHGTKLWRSGGRKDIVTSVTSGTGAEIAQAVLKQFVNQYITLVNSNKPTARA